MTLFSVGIFIVTGGHIFIFINTKYLTDTPEYSRNLEPRMLELEEQGVWKCVRKEFIDFASYFKEEKGVLFILQKC